MTVSIYFQDLTLWLDGSYEGDSEPLQGLALLVANCHPMFASVI